MFNDIDLALLNGKVITVDAKETISEAIAIKGNTILKVGTTEEIKNLTREDTKVIDVKGKLILPGFIDSHVHLGGTANNLMYKERIHSPPFKSLHEILKKIKEKVKQTPKGQWIVGRGNFFQIQKLIEKRYPTKAELDEAAPDHPVALMAGAHLTMVNTMALRLAGITMDTPQPSYGHIFKDPVTGEPTGMLSELFRVLPIPPQTYEEMKKAIKTISQTMFVQQGVTTVHEMGGQSQSVRIYQELISNNELPLRIRLYPVVPRQIGIDCLTRLGFHSGFGNEKLKLGGVKIFIDGGVSGKGAAMYEPYEGEPQNVGSLQMTPEKLNELVMRAHEAGLHVCIHACGDKGQDIAIDAIETALKKKPMKDHRHRIEHAGNYFATSERIERMKKLNIVPSPQPQMLNALGDFLEDNVGARARKIFSFRTLLNKGIKYAINSDSTGTQPEAANPLWGIWCAVARKTYNGKILCPEEKVTIMEAIRMYTINAAYTGFEEDIKGSIESGKLADIIVLSEDITTVPVDEIKDVKVEITIIDGKIVYRKKLP